MISATEIKRIGVVTAKTNDSERLMRIAMITENTSISGARIRSLIPMVQIICSWVTSLVSRVVRDAVEKVSMFLKENSWTFSNSAQRKFAANPAPAKALNREFPMAATIQISATAIIAIPVVQTICMFPPWIPGPTMRAISTG